MLHGVLVIVGGRRQRDRYVEARSFSTCSRHSFGTEVLSWLARQDIVTRGRLASMVAFNNKQETSHSPPDLG